MAKLFNLSIVTPNKTVYEGKISSLTAPSKLGYLGILADHAPLIAILTGGKIAFREDSNEQKVFNSKSDGLLEVMKNNVTILLTSF
ncbi:MAG: ATP synthase F1 subunit epsilon [Candidatus Omnitrophota bacterium]|nr:ATP synthase F1 subunit epsilon [Candidatus Omnitrophota bacterium]